MVGYDVHSGCLTLEYGHLLNRISTSRVLVDINLILENTDFRILKEGNWINVIGYVCRPGLPRKKGKSESRERREFESVTVQTIMIWDAGLIKVSDYEDALARRRVIDKSSRDLISKTN